MNEQLLKMNGLSVEILDTLSFESHLGIPLKNNLHYFDKDLLIAELVAMTEWLDEQEILSGIALDYRVKSLDSILLRRLFCFPREKSTQRRCGWSSRWKIWICPASRRARLMSRSRRMCWSIPV